MLREIHHHDGSKHIVHLGGWKRQSRDARDDAHAIKMPVLLTGTRPPSFDNRPICSPVEDQGNLGSCTAHMFAGLVEANENRRTSMSSVHVSGAVVSPTMLPTIEVGPPSPSADGTYFTYVTKVTPNVAPPPPQPSPTPAPTPPPAPTPTPSPTPAPTKLVRASRLFEYYGTRKIEGTTSEDSGASIRDAVQDRQQVRCRRRVALAVSTFRSSRRTRRHRSGPQRQPIRLRRTTRSPTVTSRR